MTIAKNGYHIKDRDAWMAMDLSELNEEFKESGKVKEINENSFPDFHKIMSEVFADFPGNEMGLEKCKLSLSNKKSDMKSTFYAIYENEKPISGAGLLIDKSHSIAYMYYTGTLKEYRKRGYQTELIKHRINIAKKVGIHYIYTIVEEGGDSWKNIVKAGLSQIQCVKLLVP